MRSLSTGGGYPAEFTAMATHLKTLILSGPPGVQSGWHRVTEPGEDVPLTEPGEGLPLTFRWRRSAGDLAALGQRRC